ncbi:sigma-54 interaction domain-containing protein [Dethiobacter alkaliphilus]|uniref:sigma-54 interaction domain-containing protein n=1 Tax=Dethiobacter alkaliphilus TaxID=427926 RepID=UPI00222806FF|nr:sigma 54-interacting transcriptional regulator [Dethiobacter alkaliphilus]MCW3490206.1 sigma 54-interacting transcriptional regulator [Dethiobacter alkaliphilus]
MLADMDIEIYELLEKAFDEFKGALVVDRNSRIVLLTRGYAEILGVDRKEAIGKPVTEVIPHSRMSEVIKSGEPEIAQVWEVKGETAIISRVPIKRGEEVIGVVAFSVFRGMDEVRDFLGRLRHLDAELNYYRSEVEKLRGARFSLENILGISPAINRVKEQLACIAKNDSTLLLTGETGTGKELFAHALHLSSKRRFGHLIKVNCAAIPDELLESELFGYEEGAFTGARKGGKPGKFELANRGTLFLDEIGEMPARLQAKLLRVLQDGEIERIGGTEPLQVDVRIVAATNKNLAELVRQRQFREDLYYRLNVIELHIPPLRERMEDIPGLVVHFIRELNHRLGVKVNGITTEVEEVFQSYHWPGNVRELYNVLERTMNVIQVDVIGLTEINWFLPRVLSSSGRQTLRSSNTLRDLEAKIIHRVLESCNGNKSRAAEILGIHRSTIYNKLKRNNG